MPIVAVAPEAVSVPEKVLLPVKVCVPARMAISLEVLASVKVRVCPELMPERSNIARFVGSALSTRLNTASETSVGWPNGCQAAPSNARSRFSSATQASQPARGTSFVQAPSTQ